MFHVYFFLQRIAVLDFKLRTRGKSRVFNAVKAYFDAKGQTRRFRVSAFMGIAAKNVCSVFGGCHVTMSDKSNVRSTEAE